jgi:hypothetical protein
MLSPEFMYKFIVSYPCRLFKLTAILTDMNSKKPKTGSSWLLFSAFSPISGKNEAISVETAASTFVP